MKTFNDTVLLRIRRQYSKDEATAFLLEEIRQLKFKIGELVSENAELKYKPEQPLKKTAKEWTLDEYVQQLKTEIEKNRIANGRANKSLVEWRNRALSLIAKYEPHGRKDNNHISTPDT